MWGVPRSFILLTLSGLFINRATMSRKERQVLYELKTLHSIKRQGGGADPALQIKWVKDIPHQWAHPESEDGRMRVFKFRITMRYLEDNSILRLLITHHNRLQAEKACKEACEHKASVIGTEVYDDTTGDYRRVPRPMAKKKGRVF